MRELVLVSQFGRMGSHVEFLHLSFREFLVAEYLLETLLLGIREPNLRPRLHVGYVSDACLDFFAHLAEKWCAYLATPANTALREMFREFLHSVQAARDGVV